MTTPITVTLRQQTPNNMKVEIALAYLGIKHQVVAVDGKEPGTIAKLVAESKQPLAPYLKRGELVIYDSSAILRYLDGNFSGPRLFSDNYKQIKEIEAWEMYTKNEPMPAMAPAFGVYFQDKQGAEASEAIAKANAELHRVTERVEQRLASQAAAGSDWLVGDAMTAADILVAPYLAFGAFPSGYAARHPLWAWFHDNVTLGESREHCRAHIQRVLNYLPAPV
ncbi:MAG: glutathione S-transferase [Bacteroidia bacterium]|jgi:glutathione S-transferase